MGKKLFMKGKITVIILTGIMMMKIQGTGTGLNGMLGGGLYLIKQNK